MKNTNRNRKNSIVSGECYSGWPLRYRATGLKSRQLVKRVESAMAELREQVKAGDGDAVGEFERLLSALGGEHQKLLRERAKDGDKKFHGQHAIDALLGFADDTISCLGWLAKNKSKDCAFWAKRRMNWPGFISILADVEKKSQEIKKFIPLGEKFSHYCRKKTKVDILFRCARFAVDYFTDHPSWDSNSGFYFCPEIKGVEWMESEKRHKAIDSYCTGLGPVTRKNWTEWKPIFGRFLTLNYGPSSERWKLIPDTPTPEKFLHDPDGETTGPKWFPKSWKENLHTAIIFGTTAEWYQDIGKKLPITIAEREQLKNEVAQMPKHCHKQFLMDISPDESLEKLYKRRVERNGKWGDYKNEILRRCYNLLPPG